ncbi:MAG: polysaccharide deacetylase family protein [Thermomicrobiales bacterium]|nr:polysaccharide deacetylase family protein [Thermomicrobiales bacterium]
MSTAKTNELLGYSADARLLIVNADDFGMSHQGNVATVRAFREGILTSTSLMLPCPWAPHAVRLLRENPALPFGIHLTIVSEHDSMRWGPRASRDKVRSLLDDEGYFFRNSQSSTLLGQATIEDVELEFRAQINGVLAIGLRPEHLDWHCLYDGGREDIFQLTVSLAREYGLAVRTHTQKHAAFVVQKGLPAVDRSVLDSYGIPIEGKQQILEQMLRQLPSGLSEWAVHPGLGDDEGKALEPDGWRVRQTDLDFVISDAACRIINEEGVVLIDYSVLRRTASR